MKQSALAALQSCDHPPSPGLNRGRRTCSFLPGSRWYCCVWLCVCACVRACLPACLLPVVPQGNGSAPKTNGKPPCRIPQPGPPQHPWGSPNKGMLPQLQGSARAENHPGRRKLPAGSGYPTFYGGVAPRLPPTWVTPVSHQGTGCHPNKGKPPHPGRRPELKSPGRSQLACLPAASCTSRTDEANP